MSRIPRPRRRAHAWLARVVSGKDQPDEVRLQFHPVTGPEPSSRRRLFKAVFWFALLHFVILQAFGGLIFMAAHIPPKAVNLDGVIDILVRIEDVLVFPRW